jgi:hypothetical protein
VVVAGQRPSNQDASPIVHRRAPIGEKKAQRAKLETSIFVLRTAILVWEVAAPNTLLVAAVVRYVIWLGVVARKFATFT